jgi:uncharacterized RDD family membrane protein YckC
MSEPGVSPIPQEARPYQGQPAGVVSRSVAAVIDAAVVLVGLLVAYGVVVAVRYLLSPLSFGLPDIGAFLSVLAVASAAILYLSLSWWLAGRSFGAHLMGLHVVDLRGRDLRLAIALLRALLCVVFPIGILWVPVSRGNRSAQDLLLRTVVLYDWQR